MLTGTKSETSICLGRPLRLGLLLLVVAAMLGCDGNDTENASTSGSNGAEGGDPSETGNPDVYLAMGNGITRGSPPTVGAPWPERLAPIIGKSVVNEGKGGTRVQYGVDNAQRFIDEHNPSFLLILYGANDVTFGNGVDTIINGLRGMIQTAKSNGVTPVIGTLSPVFGLDDATAARYDELNARIRQLAAGEGIGLADVSMEFDGDRDLILEDGIHPTPTGQQIIAFAFADAV